MEGCAERRGDRKRRDEGGGTEKGGGGIMGIREFGE